MKIEIDISVSPRTKRALKWLILPAIMLAGSMGVARATWKTDVTWIGKNKPIAAASLSANLNELEGRLPFQFFVLSSGGTPCSAGNCYVYPGPTSTDKYQVTWVSAGLYSVQSPKLPDPTDKPVVCTCSAFLDGPNVPASCWTASNGGAYEVRVASSNGPVDGRVQVMCAFY